MVSKQTKLKKLEIAVKPTKSPKIFICWCSTDEKDPDCECQNVKPSEKVIVITYED